MNNNLACKLAAVGEPPARRYAANRSLAGEAFKDLSVTTLKTNRESLLDIAGCERIGASSPNSRWA